jgi:hypothetical protein
MVNIIKNKNKNVVYKNGDYCDFMSWKHHLFVCFVFGRTVTFCLATLLKAPFIHVQLLLRSVQYIFI